MKLRIEFPNGDVFTVPAEVIARQRTEYYSTVDGFVEGSKEWDEEFKNSMSSDEILDWVQNNMDWTDVRSYADKVKSVIDYEDMWIRSEFTTIAD